MTAGPGSESRGGPGAHGGSPGGRGSPGGSGAHGGSPGGGGAGGDPGSGGSPGEFPGGDAGGSPGSGGSPDEFPGGDPGLRSAGGPEVRRRGWFEVRWRQLRRAPTPVVRAVLSSAVVASVLGILLLVYDLALDAGADLPGGDLRVLAGFLFLGAVTFLGAWLTYLVVPQPGQPNVRSKWSAALGLFAALPIAYLALVLLFQVLKPLLQGIGS